MRPHHNWWRLGILPWSDGKEVSHLIDTRLAAQFFCRTNEPVTDLLVRIVQTESGHPSLGRMISIPMSGAIFTARMNGVQQPGLVYLQSREVVF